MCFKFFPLPYQKPTSAPQTESTRGSVMGENPPLLCKNLLFYEEIFIFGS